MQTSMGVAPMRSDASSLEVETQRLWDLRFVAAERWQKIGMQDTVAHFTIKGMYTTVSYRITLLDGEVRLAAQVRLRLDAIAQSSSITKQIMGRFLIREPDSTIA